MGSFFPSSWLCGSFRGRAETLSCLQRFLSLKERTLRPYVRISLLSSGSSLPHLIAASKQLLRGSRDPEHYIQYRSIADKEGITVYPHCTNYPLTINTCVPATTQPGFSVFCGCADTVYQVSAMAENNNSARAPTLVEVVPPFLG